MHHRTPTPDTSTSTSVSVSASTSQRGVQEYASQCEDAHALGDGNGCGAEEACARRRCTQMRRGHAEANADDARRSRMRNRMGESV
ncbi:hypothetical protein B0H17DRAFT_1063227 [Mycena rosella]|uniref:Uncharacterized protein n=1 Tax=Mycena rosella TaxID=1033263 RepID=A0AAD7GF27_MYCRO|nr:hypothetical protein B0H17DRAFT_1063227 [Mycena rosella]